MSLLSPAHWAQLRANDQAHCDAKARGGRLPDPLPTARLFNPVGHANWLVTELDANGMLFGLIDQGFGQVKLGCFSLLKIEAVRLPFGMRIELDHRFWATHPLSVYAEAARLAGSIVTAGKLLDEAQARLTGGR